MSEIAIIEAFSGMPDQRRKQGTRHSLQLCLALFTLAVTAGNQGFLAIGDWLKSYSEELKELFEVRRIPSYSTIRRALLNLDYEEYSARLASFFEIKPLAGETLALDGKVLKGSYLLSPDNPHCEPHKAITLVTAYLVERGLILRPEKVENKSNEIRESAFEFYQRIRGYWGVENKVHYVRDVTQGEDKSRIRTTPLPQILAIARNLALNLYRNAGFDMRSGIL